jgi:hypothetical protein
MTSIPHPVVAAQARAAPKTATRNLALDRARTFITVLVLVHHAVMPYTYYGHTDKQSFVGLDGVVLFTDSFFMAAMFLLSGLFVWPSLQRKGAGWFLRDRWWRLGLPFVVAMLVLMPLSYYAVSLRLHPEIGFAEFWWRSVTVGPWDSGPAWFVWVLLAFDIVAALIFVAAPGAMDGLARLSQAGFDRPGLVFAALLGASIVVYLPPVLHFTASHWLVAGPFGVQTGRLLLYALYFIAGMGIGALSFDKGLLAANGQLARRWPVWLAATIVAYGCIIGLIVIKRTLLPDPNHTPLWYNIGYPLAFVCYSAAQTFNVLALFLRFGNDGGSLLDPMRDNAYGIYLIHYVPVLWLQYALFDIALTPVVQLTAVLKALIVFILALAISWSVTAALRKIPGATRVL